MAKGKPTKASHKKKRAASVPSALGPLEGTAALRRFPREQAADRQSTATIYKIVAPRIKTVDPLEYPHQDRVVAGAHELTDQLAEAVADTLAEDGRPPACGSGCDACCYFAELKVSVLETEQIVRYARGAMPAEVRQTLLEQQRNAPDFERLGHRPCPFLLRDSGACGVYPVRPMQCRMLMSTTRCRLEDTNVDGLKPVVELLKEAVSSLTLVPGALLSLAEARRAGRSHFDMAAEDAEALIVFHELEADRLVSLFTDPEDGG